LGEDMLSPAWGDHHGRGRGLFEPSSSGSRRHV